jgi:hypothetical protein
MYQQREPRLENQFVECLDCGKVFVVTASEIRWLLAHNLSVYKRCVDCRMRRKSQKINSQKGDTNDQRNTNTL